MKIRQATVDDASGIAKVHVDSWRSTYDGIIDPNYLEALCYETWEHRWAEGLSNPQPIYVAVNETDEIIGFATGGEERLGKYPDYGGEVYAIYLLEAYQGKGIGRQLIRTVAEYVCDLGYTSMLIWVLQENPSKHFYEALGGDPIATEHLTIGEKEHTEVAYGWKSIQTLLSP